jgi:fructose-bisphosphate aldolase class I
MILNGVDSGIKNETKQVAEMTLDCLKRNVPQGVPGIAFLSGGQTELEATKNLNEINIINDSKFIMTYSYGRALQQSALKFWSKDIRNIEGTQNIFNHRASMCALAAQGKWLTDLETK